MPNRGGLFLLCTSRQSGVLILEIHPRALENESRLLPIRGQPIGTTTRLRLVRTPTLCLPHPEHRAALS